MMLKLIRACIGCESPEELWFNQLPPNTEFDDDTDNVNKFAKRRGRNKSEKVKTTIEQKS